MITSKVKCGVYLPIHHLTLKLDFSMDKYLQPPLMCGYNYLFGS